MHEFGTGNFFRDTFYLRCPNDDFTLFTFTTYTLLLTLKLGFELPGCGGSYPAFLRRLLQVFLW